MHYGKEKEKKKISGIFYNKKHKILIYYNFYGFEIEFFLNFASKKTAIKFEKKKENGKFRKREEFPIRHSRKLL